MTIPLPVGVPHTSDEFTILNDFLDYYRAVIARKLDGLDAEQMRWSPVDSGTSIGGIVRHLGFVERWWFQAVFAGNRCEFPWSEEDPDADFLMPPEEDAASVIAFYLSECDRSRELVAAAPDLDVVITRGERDTTLRWILVHMIEETARHAGHADILREMLDGATGD